MVLGVIDGGLLLVLLYSRNIQDNQNYQIWVFIWRSLLRLFVIFEDTFRRSSATILSLDYYMLSVYSRRHVPTRSSAGELVLQACKTFLNKSGTTEIRAARVTRWKLASSLLNDDSRNPSPRMNFQKCIILRLTVRQIAASNKTNAA